MKCISYTQKNFTGNPRTYLDSYGNNAGHPGASLGNYGHNTKNPGTSLDR